MKKQNKGNDKMVNKKEVYKKPQSKFSSKYKDRIQSIQTSDYKREQNLRLEKEKKEKEEFLKEINNKQK